MKGVRIHHTAPAPVRLVYFLTFSYMLENRSRKILIVEDDATISTLYRIKFEKEGYIVKVSGDGMEAVTHVMEFAPDAILLDIMMPSMDGFEALRVIRELAPSLHTKIIMFSNLNRQTDIDRCIASGADAYLLKAETTPSDAVRKVEELFSSSQMRRKSDTVTSEEASKPCMIHCKCPNCGEEFEQSVSL